MLRIESYKKGILFSTTLNFLAKGVGFINTLIIAHYFGTNAGTDIYFYVLSIALVITSTINGIDFLILVPEAMRLREETSVKESQKFINFFVFLYLLIGLAFTIAVLISPISFYSIFSKFDANLLSNNSKLLHVGSVIIVFQLLNNLLAAVLTSYKYFTASILAGLINSLFAIVFTMILHDEIGITGTMIGVAIGYIINFFILVFILIRFQDWQFSNVSWMKKKEVWSNIGLMQVNILPIWVRNSVGLYLISGLGKGLLTSVNLGQQLSNIPEVLITTQMLAVGGIKFNELFAKHNHSELNVTFLKLCESGIYITMLVAFSSFLFAEEIVKILYSNSEIGDTGLTNIETAFRYFIFCLPVKFISTVSTNVLTASQKIRSIFGLSITTHIVVTIVMIILVNNFGLTGYLVGINVHFYLFFFLFYPIIRRVVPFISYYHVFRMAILNMLINVVVYLIVFSLFHFNILAIANIYVKVSVGISMYMALLVIANEIVGVNKFLKIKNICYAIRRII